MTGGRRWAGHAAPRRGQATVEFAFAVMMFLGVVVGMVDVARGIIAHLAVGEMAWAGGRHASLNVGGTAGGRLDPVVYDAILANARRAAFGIDASMASISVDFPDGERQPGQRVRVRVVYPFVPAVAQFTGGQRVEISSTALQIILH